MSREPVPDPFADEPDWPPKPPRPTVPTPARQVRTLRGRRVAIGLPGLGWRTDLRADEKIVQGSRTYVPVMPEHEWYRAEAEQMEVFAPLVPVERVWADMIGQAPTEDAPHGTDVVSRLVSLDAPPTRDPVPVVDAVALTGRRVIQIVDGRERRDLRAVTELHTSSDGDICVRVAAELDWYRWAWSGQSPKTMEVPVHVLWLE